MWVKVTDRRLCGWPHGHRALLCAFVVLVHAGSKFHVNSPVQFMCLNDAHVPVHMPKRAPSRPLGQAHKERHKRTKQQEQPLLSSCCCKVVHEVWLVYDAETEIERETYRHHTGISTHLIYYHNTHTEVYTGLK